MVAALTIERDTQLVQKWLSDQTGKIAISRWVVTEFSGALAMKRRIGVLDDNGWDLVMSGWRLFLREVPQIHTLSDDDFQRAASIMDGARVKLRSGDALHLSVALDRNWTIATLDHDLAKAGRTLGAKVDTVLT